MATINRKPRVYTEEGGRAQVIGAELQLRRSVMSCMLWEKEFYCEGEAIADRIKRLVKELPNYIVADMAREARGFMNLRHVPLLLARELARKTTVKQLLIDIIQRPDELTEFLAIYWKDGKCPLSASVKKGLAGAFGKFNEYQLAKYNRDGAIKLKDVLFMVHAKPKDNEQAQLWARLIDDKMEIPDTWEVQISKPGDAQDKMRTWERLMEERKLGGMAFMRNLRNMQEAGVSRGDIRAYFDVANFSRVHPFRFIASAQAAPDFETELEKAMIKSIDFKMPGRTKILVDVSGSMSMGMAGRSKMNRVDAAMSLAVVMREMSDDVDVYSFSNEVVKVPPRHGFGLVDAIRKSQYSGGTRLGMAVQKMDESLYDRLIVVTDEQSHDRVPDPKGIGYMINVASNKNGVGYGKWNHVDGFSDGVVRWIVGLESLRMNKD